MSEKEPKKFIFGNEKFGGSYRPGELELTLPDELSRDEFEDMFIERLGSLHKIGREIIPFDEDDIKEKKEKLKPLSTRVKTQTKEFFKNHSILTPREVLELYEDYNTGSEAFIDSLLREEEALEMELAALQEKLHNARLFKAKLSKLNLEKEKKNDEEMIAALEEEFEDSQIKTIFDESSEMIIKDIQLYNTQKIELNDDYLEIIAVNDVIPIIYYFSSEMEEDDLVETLSEVKAYCSDNEIEFIEAEAEAEEEVEAVEEEAEEDGE